VLSAPNPLQVTAALLHATRLGRKNLLAATLKRAHPPRASDPQELFSGPNTCLRL
jgi:hypothetical protein